MRLIKLQRPPRHRQRIREVAKELNLTSRQLLAELSEMGEYASSAAAYVEAPVIRAVHDRHGVAYTQPDEVQGEPAPQGVGPASTSGLGPPRPRERRDNHPLMNEASRPRDRAGREGPRRGAPASGSAGEVQARWEARSVEQQWSQASAGDAAPAFEYEEWKLRGFTEVERDVWLDAGLRASQAKWAAELRDGGLRPADLQTDLHGWKVIDRLRCGEGAVAVVRLLSASRGSQAG